MPARPAGQTARARRRTSSVVVLDCKHRGPQIRTDRCADCVSHRVPIFTCAQHTECATDKLVRGSDGRYLQTCHTCQQRDDGHPRGLSPLRRLTFDEHNLAPGAVGKRFNSSLAAHDAGFVLAFRTGWKDSQIHIAELDNQFTPRGDSKQLHLQHALACYGAEDPRLFTHNSDWHVAFTGVFGKQKILHTHQLYARLRDHWTVDAVYYPDFAARREWEKNWAFFSHDGHLYAVYTIAPHRILRITGSTATLTHESPWSPTWRGGDMRGGAAPVRVEDEFYSWFHDRIIINGVKIYRTGLYTFEARPPFLPRRCVREPILVADRATKPPDQYTPVIFTCGAVRRNGQWIISSGVHDRWTQIDVFDASEIEARLETV